MALLQIVAAQMSGIDHVIYHTVSADGSTALMRAINLYEDLIPKKGEPDIALGNFIESLCKVGLYWGFSNGT
jgi:hypothetical protein